MHEPKELDPLRDLAGSGGPQPDDVDPADDPEDQHAAVVARWRRWLRGDAA